MKSLRKLCITYWGGGGGGGNPLQNILQGLSTANSVWSGLASTSQQVVLFSDYTTAFLKISTHVLNMLPKPLTLKEAQMKYFQIRAESL